jgi:hypothetical protein
VVVLGLEVPFGQMLKRMLLVLVDAYSYLQRSSHPWNHAYHEEVPGILVVREEAVSLRDE